MRDTGLIPMLQRPVSSAWRELRSQFAGELAIDLGSANTRIFALGRGLVLNEPSVLAMRPGDNRVVAAGHMAKPMIGRAPASIRVARPIREGVIANIDAASTMLAIFIRRAHSRSILFSSRPLFCIPAEISSIEQRAFEEVAYRVGARKARFIEGPLAAAAAVSSETSSANASAIVDIGAETIDLAVINCGGLIQTATTRIGGRAIDLAIARRLREIHNLEVGEETAEMLKQSIGSASTSTSDRVAVICGLSLETGLPTRLSISSAEVHLAMAPVVTKIANAVSASINTLPPEVVADLLDKGVLLTGGGAQLPGLPERMSDVIRLEVSLATNPTLAAITGAARILWPDVSASSRRPLIEGVPHGGVATLR